jgi:sirohydrochlorin ferrochelatase
MRGVVLLMGHGSPDRDGCAELVQLRGRLADQLAFPVRMGVLEFATAQLPHLEAAFAELGAADIVAAQPLLLFEGIHGRKDMPAVAARMADQIGLEVRLGSPFGDDPVLIDLLETRLLAFGAGPQDVLLFVGRGSSEVKARRQTETLAAELARRLGLAHEVCYAGISHPDLTEGIELALKHEGRRVFAVPYLLHTGVLHRRVSDVLGPIAQARGRALVVLPHIGNAAEVVALLASRVRALLAVTEVAQPAAPRPR